MRDAVFVAITIGFFAICVAYIRACAWIIGHETVTELEPGADLVEAQR